MLPRNGGTPRYIPKIGLFSDYETVNRRTQRLTAGARAASRQSIRNIQDVALPAVVARWQRRIRDTSLQSKQLSDTVLRLSHAPTPGVGVSLGASLFQNLDVVHKRSEERERHQQELDIATARRRLDRVEHLQQPLKLDEAENVLAGRGNDVLAKRQEATQRLRKVEQQLQPRYLSIEAQAEAEHIPGVVAAIERVDLTTEQRIAAYRAISERNKGHIDTTVSDAFRIASNVKTGRDPEFIKGVYAQPEFRYDRLPPEATDYTKSLLHLSLETPRGRLLAQWQQNLAEASGHKQEKVDRLAADQFKVHVDSLRDTLRGAGVPEQHLDAWIDMEIRRAELTDQAQREGGGPHP